MYLVAWGVVLSGCATTPPDAAISSVGRGQLFDTHVIITSEAPRQTVLTGFLLEESVADLVVVEVDANGDRRANIYAFDGESWRSTFVHPLDPDVSFVDVAEIHGRDRLIAHANGRLWWLDPETEAEHEIVAVPFDVDLDLDSSSAIRRVYHVDVTRDVNGDGRDDLVVPGANGFVIFIQAPDGRFVEPVTVGRPLDTLLADVVFGYRVDPWSRGGLYAIDFNHDGRADIVFWNEDEDHFEVHLQEPDGSVAAQSTAWTSSVAFETDDMTWLAAPSGVRGRRTDHQAEGELTGRVLHALRDANGDGVGDLIVFSLEGGSLWKMRSKYEVHLGAVTDGGTSFSLEPSMAVESKGIPFDVAPYDLDRDSVTDVTLSVIEPGFFKAVGLIADALFTGWVSLDVELYRMEPGVQGAKPVATRKTKARPGASGQRTAFPAVLIADVNGDARSDLLMQHRFNELRVYPGVAGPELFARRPHKVPVAIAMDEYTWLADLNRDGKDDVVMHYPDFEQPHRVTILMAR